VVATGTSHLTNFSPFSVRLNSYDIELSFECVSRPVLGLDVFEISEQMVEFELRHIFSSIALQSVTRSRGNLGVEQSFRE
jgi:hypothetical protein